MSAPTVQTVHEVCARYHAENGFDTAVDEHDHILLRTGATDGILMPAELAERVEVELIRRDMAAPIIVNTRTDLWMLLTQGASHADRSVAKFGALYRYRATMTTAGALITLPGPGDEVRYWHAKPVGHRRPSFNGLADITLRVAHVLAA
ncbi:hypothetical protein [Nocardia sp. NPDC057030]|uniref:hypothetical protein n=1 Tax=unclassified Nocardia TaxID=2637762 RepID=UPI00364085A1